MTSYLTVAFLSFQAKLTVQTSRARDFVTLKVQCFPAVHQFQQQQLLQSPYLMQQSRAHAPMKISFFTTKPPSPIPIRKELVVQLMAGFVCFPREFSKPTYPTEALTSPTWAMGNRTGTHSQIQQVVSPWYQTTQLPSTRE